MKASLTFYPNEAKKNQKTNRIPVYMRVCFKAKKSETRLNVELSESEKISWDPITLRVLERNSAVNHYLNRLDQKFSDLIITQATSLPNYTAAAIRDYIMGIDSKNGKTVLQFVDDYFNEAVVNHVDRAPGTIKNYRRAINHLVSFLTSYSSPSFLIKLV